MSVIEAIILGFIQGLTEFLPVSSSGHLEIGQALFGISGGDNLKFDIVLHGATILSTLIVFRKEITELILGIFTFKWDDNNKYIVKLLISAIPVGIAGVVFGDKIETLFSGNLIFIGSMLIATALLLTVANYVKKRTREITYLDALVIGIAQMIAVIPGISRSGSTIATGLILGNDKNNLAKFSFLMVIIPIVGVNLLKVVSGDLSANSTLQLAPMLAGFIAAFVTGLLACKWMINIVRKGKLIYFAIYCAVIGLIAIFAA